MPKMFVVPMPDDFEKKGRIRYRSVDVKTMRRVQIIKPEEISGTWAKTLLENGQAALYIETDNKDD